MFSIEANKLSVEASATLGGTARLSKSNEIQLMRPRGLCDETNRGQSK